jgi:tetratricopeptide (TPR) repeat protein
MKVDRDLPEGEDAPDAAFGREPREGAEASYGPDEAARLEAVLERAGRLGDEGDFEGMAEHLRQALEDFPGDPFVLCWLGVAERELGMNGIAYERFKRCLAAQPTDPHVLATAGNAVAAFDDPDAEPALRAAAVMAPDLPLARWMYGAYLSREGYPDKALEELHAARELDPSDPIIAFELGVAHALAGDRPAAVDAVFRAAELDREDGWTLVVLGLLLLEQDRPEEALAELSAGARLRPEDVEAQLLASLAASVSGRDDLAWEMLERGRQRAEGGDREVAEEVDLRITEGPDAALELLRTRLAPAALRERLMTRP